MQIADQRQGLDSTKLAHRGKIIIVSFVFKNAKFT